MVNAIIIGKVSNNSFLIHESASNKGNTLKQKRLSFDFKFLNWQSLILIAIAILYGVQFATLVVNGRVPVNYGDDYFAFWSVGKIADEKGYSQIYDLNELKNVQINSLRDLGVKNFSADSFSPLPVSIFAIFIPVLQLFSKLPPGQGYWIWTLINCAVYFFYIGFFIKRISEKREPRSRLKNPFFLALVSFPFFITIAIGQINVFLTVSLGEFIRNGYEEKPYISGLWLGGLLLKPQLLILIVPILFFQRYWKAIWGFLVSAVVVLSGSLLLSGFRGMFGLFDLWFKYSGGLATSAVEYMVNWRMLGQNTNTLLHTSLGWMLTATGIIISLLLVCWLVEKAKPVYGSPVWVLMMLGVFSATTIITWHSHYAMSLVLVPLLIFVTSHQMLHQRYFFVWVIVTPIVILVIMILSILSPAVAELGLIDAQGMINAILGLALNLMLLYCTVQKSLFLSLT